MGNERHVYLDAEDDPRIAAPRRIKGIIEYGCGIFDTRTRRYIDHGVTEFGKEITDHHEEKIAINKIKAKADAEEHLEFVTLYRVDYEESQQ